MPRNPDLPIVVAFPEREKDRAEIRRLIDHPLPSKYPGATVMPCGDCGRELSVGPMSRAKIEAEHLPLCCPKCAAKRTGPHPGIVHFGNPNSGWEKK